MSSIPVYTGFWHDYSVNGAGAWTLTLNVRWSGFLLAALSAFVGIVGASFWSILAFAIHQFRARPGQEDVLYMQQQAVYRNPSSAFGTVIELFNICWAWRSRRQGTSSQRIAQRSVLFSLPPLVVFVGFTIAAVFVGDVTRPTYEGNDVKIKSSNCGILVANNQQSLAALSTTLSKGANDTIAARAYARSCYGQTTATSACGLYAQQSLPYTRNNVKCPFGQGTNDQRLCSVDSALMLDSGLLDSSEYLGINAPKNDRILFRRSLTCSPINITAYQKPSNLTDEDGFTNWQYFLGPIDGVSDWTYVYDTHKSKDSFGYQVWPVSDATDWTPISPLQVTDANTVVVLLSSNSVEYLNPVTDPWFMATTPGNVTSGTAANETFMANSYITALACIDQYQICNPNRSPYSCTLLGQMNQMLNGSSEIDLNPTQNATAQRVGPYLTESNTQYTVSYLGNSALLAQDHVSDILGAGLPPNQWQIEVEGWFAVALAKLQALAVEYPIQPTHLPAATVQLPSASSTEPSDHAARAACSNQRIRNTGAYQSFSAVALVVIIVIGVAIILTSWTVECCVAAIRQRRRAEYRVLRNAYGGPEAVNDDHVADYREIARIADRTLQMQRMVLANVTPDVVWQGTMDSVPCPREQHVRFALPTRVPAGEGKSEDDFRYESMDRQSNSQEQREWLEESVEKEHAEVRVAALQDPACPRATTL